MLFWTTTKVVRVTNPIPIPITKKISKIVSIEVWVVKRRQAPHPSTRQTAPIRAEARCPKYIENLSYHQRTKRPAQTKRQYTRSHHHGRFAQGALDIKRHKCKKSKDRKTAEKHGTISDPESFDFKKTQRKNRFYGVAFQYNKTRRQPGHIRSRG